jgi:O-antigen/teichoic acid export membrane protein
MAGLQMTEPSSSIIERTARGAGWMLAWRMLNRGLGLASTLILVRLLAPDDFGLISLAFAFSTTLDACATIGTEAQIIRSRDPGRSFYDTAFTMNVMRAALLALLTAAAAGVAARWFGDPRLENVLYVVAVLSLLQGFANIRLVAFQRDLRFDKEFLVLGVPRLLQTLATVGFAFWLRNYWGLLAGMLVGRGAGIMFGYALYPYLPRPTLREWRQLLAPSLWTWGISVAMIVRDRTDSFVIGRTFGTAAVGLYAVSVEIASLPLTELINPVSAAAMPGFAASLRAQDTHETRATYLRVLALTVLLAVPIGVGLSAVASPLVMLALGSRWQDAGALIAIMGLMFIPIAPGMVANALLVAHGRFRLLFQVMVAAAISRLVFVIGIGRHHGLTGVAMSVGMSVLIEQGALLAMAARTMRIGPGVLVRQAWRPAASAAVMAALLAAAGLGWTVAPPDAGAATLQLIAAMPLGAAAFLVAAITTWLAAGRPDAAETDILKMLTRTARTLGGSARALMPARRSAP